MNLLSRLSDLLALDFDALRDAPADLEAILDSVMKDTEAILTEARREAARAYVIAATLQHELNEVRLRHRCWEARERSAFALGNERGAEHARTQLRALADRMVRLEAEYESARSAAARARNSLVDLAARHAEMRFRRRCLPWRYYLATAHAYVADIEVRLARREQEMNDIEDELRRLEAEKEVIR